MPPVRSMNQCIGVNRVQVRARLNTGTTGIMHGVQDLSGSRQAGLRFAYQ